MKSYILNTVENVIEQASQLHTAQDYIENKRRRNELADFYKRLINLGSSFPPVPGDMNLSVATSLYKDISNSCPDCVKPSVMLETVKDALRVIYKYIKELEQLDIEAWKVQSVHDLKPNI